MPKSSKKETEKLDASTEQKIVEEVKVRKTFFGHSLRLVLFFVLLITVGLLFFFAYNFTLSKKTAEDSSDPLNLMGKIGRHLLLPENEVPTVATVTDREQLANQDFFKFTENGDKVLFFGVAKKAILYRPSRDLIINMAPLDVAPQISPNVATSSPTLTENSSPPKITILNGTQKSGLTRTAESTIKNAGIPIEVALRGNAKTDYAASIVVDLSGKNKSKTEEIAKIIGGKIGSLPEAEEAGEDSEILIILGSDFGNN